MNDLTESLRALSAIILKVPVKNLTENSSPDTVESWDSLAHMKLVLAVEEKFKVRLTDSEIINIDSFGKLCELVKGKQAHG